VVGSVDQPLADVTGAAAPVVGGIDQSLADAAGASAPVVGSVDQPLADVTGAAAPVVGGIDQSLAAAAGASAPVVGSVDQPLADVTAATAPVVGGIDQSLAAAAGATAPVAGGIDQSVTVMSSAATPAFGSVDHTLAGLPATAATPQAGDAAAAVPEQHAAPPVEVPPGFAHAEAGAGTTHDVAMAFPPPVADLAHPGGVATGPDPYTPVPDAVGATDDGGISITQILGTGYVAWKLAIFAALLASVSRWSANATGCLSSVRLVTFTNVQLIRCGLASPIMRMASASATAVSQVVGTAGATPSVRARVGGVRGVIRTLRDVVSGPKAAVARTLGGDGALMMRIGKLLGLLYAGFLAVWFWATRLRWNGR
jgi:hypothetical protein